MFNATLVAQSCTESAVQQNDRGLIGVGDRSAVEAIQVGRDHAAPREQQGGQHGNGSGD